MRITFVLPFVNLTGGIRVLLDLANWLHDEGHQVTVAYPAWPYRYHFSRGDQWREFLRQRRRAASVGWFDLRCRLLRVPVVANAFMPPGDLVIATSWPTVHSVARLHASRGRKVHALFHHETETGPEGRIRRIYELPFYRIVFSQAVRDSIARQFGCEIHDKVPLGVNTTLFFPDGERRRCRVLMLYHDAARKGAADGLEALRILRERMAQVEISLCGTVRPKCLPDWAPFEFFPGDAQLRRLYSTSTALLYPSRDEGFGLPPLEAMACGCPVVTTSVGAIPEFAADRDNALVVQPGDVCGMADRIEEVLREAPLQKALSERGLETARRYSLPRVAPLFGAALTRAFESGS